MTLLILGALFLIGLVADVAGRLTPLPRVTVLLLAGVLVGPAGFDVVPAAVVDEWFPLLTHMALAMVGFLLGQTLSIEELRESGREALLLALGKVLGSALLVFAALMAIGLPYPLALVFAGVATATAPTATFDVAHELGAKGPFASLLLKIVAVDDAWGLILFSVLLALAASTFGGDGTVDLLWSGVLEALGSVTLGALLGVPMAYLTGRLEFGSRSGEPIQAEAFGFVLLAAGAAVVLELSPILTAMAMGAVVASLATHHARPFSAIEGVEWPFMILFFVLAGASLRIDGEETVLVIVLCYVVARGVGGYLGIFGFGAMLNSSTVVRRWMGLALLPQAGVALGMALIASQRLPEFRETILGVVLLSTVVLELTSPLLTRRVLRRVSGD